MTIPGYDEMVEAAARAMCVEGGFDPDKIMANDGPRWRYYVPGARAALSRGVSEELEVSIKPMRLSDGRTDYFVSFRHGDREVTPHVFREQYIAEYHVALYRWAFGQAAKPDLMAFDEDIWPAREYTAEEQQVFAAISNQQAASAPDLLAALKVAVQLAEIASDWNLNEVEIDGEMVSIYALIDRFRAAISSAEGSRP